LTRPQRLPSSPGAVLRRVVPLVGVSARVLRAFALAAAAAGIVIALFLLRDGLPADGVEAAAEIVAIALTAVPPVVLLLLASALGALAEVPARVRSIPASGREHAAELRRLTGEAAGHVTRRRLLLLPLVGWRLASLVVSARELATPYAPAAALASVPFLAASALAAVGALVEIAVAIALLVVLLAAW
jgi:hypothetical protein